MPEPHGARATLRAAAEVFVPGLAEDQTPGAPEVSAERFLAHYLDFMMPGFDAAVAQLLDETARAMFDGVSFADLDIGARGRVLDAIGEHQVEQLHEIPTLLGVLSIASVYGEWSGTDASGAVGSTPLGWALTGFDGPARARPDALR